LDNLIADATDMMRTSASPINALRIIPARPTIWRRGAPRSVRHTRTADLTRPTAANRPLDPQPSASFAIFRLRPGRRFCGMVIAQCTVHIGTCYKGSSP